MNVSALLAQIKDAKLERPGHVNYRTKQDMANIAEQILEEFGNLIAAAPDLLAALIEAKEYVELMLESSGADDGEGELLSTIYAALEKAGIREFKGDSDDS